jgi:S1-C subfamily serine protease
MKIKTELKKKINKCVVRIIAEELRIDWNMPFTHKSPVRGQGTGFFIDNKGHILTCAHVVDGSRNIYIEIPNISSDKYQCYVVGICPKFDIALLKCKNYCSKEYLELGDSDKLQVGTEVQVVGYPASLLNSHTNSNNLKYTVGIIGGQQGGLIQTDSAINPGNSGGPLFSNNKVIGINSQKLVGEALENIGYSIPINNYKIIKKDFKDKIIYRPNLLIEYDNTDKELLKNLTKDNVSKGIMVSKIYDESIIKKSGIKEGNIITDIGKYKLDNFGLTLNYKWIGTNINLNILLNKFSNDEEIKIKYYDILKQKFNITKIKLKPIIFPIRILYPVFEEIPYTVFGGIVFSNLSENYILHSSTEAKKKLDLVCILENKEESLKPKVCITTILNKKINILNNIHKGDIVKKVNDIEVSNIKELNKALLKVIIINKKKYIKIENTDGKSIIVLIDDLLKEDEYFSNIYNYPMSKIYNNIYK